MAGNDIEIRVRVRDQGTSSSLSQIEGRGRSFATRFAGEGERAGQGFSRGLTGGIAGGMGAIRSLSIAGVVSPLVIGLAGSLQQLAGAGALLPGALGAGAAIIGTLKMALGGVSEALTATSSGASSTGQNVAAMARQIRDANRAIEDAQQGVIAANQRLEDAHYGVEQAVRRVDDANRGVVQALRRVEDAQDAVTDAVRAYERAQADEQQALAAIDGARKDAIRTLQDLAEAQDDSVRGVEGAELALKRALADQIKVMKDSKATQLDRAEAAFRVKEAEDRLSDSQRTSQQVTEDLADAQAKGVEGSDQVVAAQQAAADAHERTADAADRVADAEQGVADAQEGVAEARRGVEDAERGVAEARRAVADAERGVIEAERDVADAIQNLNDIYAQQREAAMAAAGGVDAYAAAMAKLSPNAREFVKVLRDELGPEWEKLQRSVQDRFFEGFAADARELGGKYIPLLAIGLGGIADELNEMARYAADALLDPQVIEAVNVVLANTAGFLDSAGTSLGDFLAGFIQLAAIGSEYLPQLGQWIADIAARFREWVEVNPDGVREFIDAAIQGFSDLWAIGENLFGIISSIAEGLAGGTESGEGFLGTIRDLTASILEFVESEGVQGFLAFVGWVVQKMIEWAPVTMTIIGALIALQGVIALVNFGMAIYSTWQTLIAAKAAVVTAAQWLWNAALSANPIGLVVIGIAALIAAFIWAWNNIEGFRAFWIAVWDGLVAAFNWAKDAVVAGWNWLMSTIGGAASWIGGVLSSMWDGLTNGLKAAVNGAIWLLNGLIQGVNVIIGGINAVNPFGSIGYVPYVNYLAKGGIASGQAIVGERGPELVDLPSGSRVHPAGDTQRMLADQAGQGGSGGGGALELRVAPGSDGAVATMVMNLVRTGKIQLVQVGR